MYNCNLKGIELPNQEGLLNFGIKKGCSIPEESVYCQEGTYSNLIKVKGLVDNYTQYYDPLCPDPPGVGCNTCPQYVTFDYNLGFDPSLVQSASGVLTVKENNVVTSTTNITSLSFFDNTLSIQTYYSFEIIYTVNFTLTNGIVFETVTTIFNNGGTCDLESYSTSVQYYYDCLNYYQNLEDSILIPIELSDGFYTMSVDGETSCFIIECSPLDCRIYSMLEFCNSCDKKLLESFTMFILLDKCEDCCTKYELYKKIYTELNKCTTC